jgi:putative ABC transport system permease protein
VREDRAYTRNRDHGGVTANPTRSGILRAAFKGVVARRFRLALTGIAVVLGVSFVVTTYALTDTLDRSFRHVFDETLSGVDVVVRARTIPGEDDHNRFSDSVVRDVRADDRVASAGGFTQGYAQFVGKDGRAVETGGVPPLGVSWIAGASSPFRLVDDGARRSRAPAARGEVAMDVETARENGFRLGDRVDVLSAGPKERFRLVGLFALGSGGEVGPISFAAFDLPTAQGLFAAPGLVNAVYVNARPGVSVAELRESVTARLPHTLEVSTAAPVAADSGADITDFLDLLTGILLGFAAIGLVVAAFIIFNTFTILVAQRTRELGLLRALGASRPQIIGSVMTEAGVVGLGASLVGLGLGVLLARVLLSVVGAIGFDTPQGAVVVQQRTVLLAIAVGMFVTVGAALWPAIRASAVPPVVAMNDVPLLRTPRQRVRIVIGGCLIAVGIPVLLVGIARSRDADDVLAPLRIVGAGSLLVFFGVVVLLATFARPLARVLGWPIRATGVTGTIARGNAMRNPRRTAATASALVIGLALVEMVAIFGESAKASVRSSSDEIRADLVVDTKQFTGFSPDVVHRVAALPEIADAVGFRFGRVRPVAATTGEKEHRVVAVNGTGLERVLDLELRSGHVADIGDDGMLVFADDARSDGLAVGDRVPLNFPAGRIDVRVAGVYGQPDLFWGSPFVISDALFRRGFVEADLDYRAYATAAAGVDATTARRAATREIGNDFPNVRVLTRDEYRDDQERAIDEFLAVTVALLLLSEVIAILGIVNTLALSVFERTREIGMLRAVGMSRRQLRGVVRGESLIIAAIGSVVGVAVGLLWGWAFATALESEDIAIFTVPTGRVLAFMVVSVLAGIVAAVVPAWRAARLDVLDAIATE